MVLYDDAEEFKAHHHSHHERLLDCDFSSLDEHRRRSVSIAAKHQIGPSDQAWSHLCGAGIELQHDRAHVGESDFMHSDHYRFSS
jgi:hypothetical protein